MPTVQSVVDAYLTKHHSPPKAPFSLLVLGKNLTDGHGDFLHVLHFFQYLRNRFKDDPRVVITGLCFIDEQKRLLVEKIYQEDFERYGVISINMSGQDILPGSFVLCDKDFRLSSAIDPNFVLNVSASVRLVNHFISRMSTNRSRPIFSWLEYGAEREGCASEVCGGKITERAMGVQSHQVGIKIFPRALQTTADEAVAGIRQQMESGLVKYLLEEGFLGYGYLQEPRDTLKFALVAANMNPNRIVTLLVDTKFFLEGEDGPNAQSNEWLGLLVDKLKKGKTVGKIEFISNTGECVSCISLNTDKQPPILGVLRLIHFPGTSEAYKQLILPLCNIIGASGDTSISEMISAKKFPFFGVRDHKLQFIFQIIGDLRYRFPQFKECIQYLEEGYYTELYDYPQYLYFVRTHAKTIGRQWEEYCFDLSQRCDVKNSIDHLFDTAVICQMSVMGDDGEKKEAAPFMDAISAENERHAALLEIISCVENLYVTDTEKAEIFKQKVQEFSGKFGALPIVELVVGSLAQPLDSSNLFYLRQLVGTVFFKDSLSTLIPLLLQAVDSSLMVKLTDPCISWLKPFAIDENFAKEFLEKLDGFYRSQKLKKGVGLFATESPIDDERTTYLLCKIILLAFLAVRIEDPGLLFKSEEWQSATGVKNRFFQEVIAAVQAHEKLHNAPDSLQSGSSAHV